MLVSPRAFPKVVVWPFCISGYLLCVFPFCCSSLDQGAQARVVSARICVFDTDSLRTMVRRPKDVPDDVKLDPCAFVPPIGHLDIGQQKQVVLRKKSEIGSLARSKL